MTEALVVFWLLKELIISERGKAFCQVPPGTSISRSVGIIVLPNRSIQSITIVDGRLGTVLIDALLGRMWLAGGGYLTDICTTNGVVVFIFRTALVCEEVVVLFPASKSRGPDSRCQVSISDAESRPINKLSFGC
jgi:hypothetical protein